MPLKTKGTDAFLSRWYRDVALGLFLDQAVNGEEALTDGDAMFLFGRFIDEMALFDTDGSPHSGRLSMLTPATLEQLSRVRHRSLNPLSDAAGKVRDNLRGPQPGGTTPLFQAKLIANRLRSGTHTPHQIVKMMEKEMGYAPPKGAELDDLKVRIQRLVNTASYPNYAFPKVLRAVEHLSRAFPTWWKWQLIENSLLHGLFLWPMFVMTASKVAGTTLPLQLHVYVPKPNEPFKTPGVVIELPAGKKIKTGPLYDSAKKALERTIGLWNEEFSNWAPEYRALVRRTQITIDLSHAMAIRKRAGFEGDWNMSPESLEADLALGMMGRLLGDTSVEGVSASGVLGDPIYNGRDSVIDNIEEAWVKLERLSRIPEIDRIIMPASAIEYDLIKKSCPKHLSLAFGKTLSDYARAAFPDSFRRNQFIRCPDLRLAYRGELPRDQPTDEATDMVRQIIENSSGPILELPGGTDSAAVARAIFWMNSNLDAYVEDAQAVYPSAKPENFLQSCIFIRPSAYESNERFWQVVWETLTGSLRLDLPLQAGTFQKSTGWRSFAYSLGRNASVQPLADKLNRCHANYWEPWRIPDRVIIIGSDKLRRHDNYAPRGPFKRLQLDEAFLGALEPKLGQIRETYVTDRIGKARLILLPEDSRPARPTLDLQKLPNGMQSNAKLLSTFPNGFNFDTAKAVLDVDYWDCRGALKALCKYKIEGVPLLSEEPQSLTYFFNFEIVEIERTLIETARAAYRCGMALAGLSAKRFDAFEGQVAVSANYRQMLKPAQVHDAEQLLGIAKRAQIPLPRKERDFRTFQAIEAARQTVARYGEPFSWSFLRHVAFGNIGDGTSPELRAAAIDHLENWTGIAHPVELSIVALLIWNEYWGTPDPNTKKELADYLCEVLRRAEMDAMALSKSGETDALSECHAGLFTISSTMLAAFLERREDVQRRVLHEIGTTGLDAPPLGQFLKEYFRWTKSFLNRASDVLRLDWFVYRGDYPKSDAKAMWHYSCAISNDLSGLNIAGLEDRSSFLDPLVKYLGCSARLGLEDVPPLVVNRIAELETYQLDAILNRTQPRLGLRDRDVLDRWTRGIERLAQIRASC